MLRHSAHENANASQIAKHPAIPLPLPPVDAVKEVVSVTKPPLSSPFVFQIDALQMPPMSTI